MKILKYIFNTIVWVSLSLYLCFILAFSIPAVQEYLGRRVSTAMAAKLGTSVSIERIELSFPCHLAMSHVNIKDQQGCDMLRTRRLSVRMDLLPLLQGRISISTAQFFGTHAKLYQTSADTKPNFQFVLDSLASKDTTSNTPIDLRINSLIMRHSSVSFNRYDLPETPARLNPAHLEIKDISAHVILKVLTQDSLNLNVKRLSFKEKSGLWLDRLAFKFEGGRKNLHLKDFSLRMAGTNIQLGDFDASYHYRGNHFVTPSLSYKGSIEPSTVTLSDISCLLPSLSAFNSTLSISSAFNGQGESLAITSLSVGSTTGDIMVDLSGWIKDLRQDSPRWMAEMKDLSLSAKTVNFITENLRGEHVEVPEAISRLGNIHLNGAVSGRGIASIDGYNLLTTDAGSVRLKYHLNEQRQFNGKIDTEGFQLGHVLDDERLGVLSSQIELCGTLQAGNAKALQADGIIQQLDYNGYSYRNININGSYTPESINGKLTIDDPNIGLNIEGKVVTKGNTRNVQMNASLLNFSPKATHLTDKWGDARFFTDVSVHFIASNIGDAVGSIDITDFSMQSPNESYELNQLHLHSGYSDKMHYITMSSDFGEATLKGEFDYHTLTQSVVNFIAAKLPTLPGLPRQNFDTHNEFTFQATITKSDWMQHLLQLPVYLNSPLTVYSQVNDSRHQLTLECNVPDFFYKDSHYKQTYLSILSPLNTLSYNVMATKIMEGGQQMDLHMDGNAFNNQLNTTCSWDNHASERMSGEIRAATYFDTSFDGRETIHLMMMPSHITVRNTEWSVESSHITYADKHLDINHFAIRHGQQHLTLAGTASPSTQDTVSISMKDLDIDYILDLVDFDAVSFGGRATGQGTLRGLFGHLEADGELEVGNFTFENGRMGTLHARVEWNKEQEQIDIHATADDGPEAQTLINGYVSPDRNYIDLGIDAQGTYLDFAQSFTSTFLRTVTGHADGRLRLAGPLDAINLTGELVLNGIAEVGVLGCSYEMRNDTLRLIPNEIEFAHCPIYDALNNKAVLTGGIHHKDLTNLTFDIFVDAVNLLAYNFQDFGDDTFYGTVYADGNVAIHGRGGSTTIEADITPQHGSTFVYNAASPDAITNQEFIEWGVKDIRTSKNRRNLHETQPATDVTPDEQAFRSDLHMQLHINATPDATIRLLMDPRTNDYITLRGTGDLQTSYYNKGAFTMFGTYRVTEGTYGVTIQDIIKKNFIFREGGTIVFGGDPYDATLNLQALYTINSVSLSDLNVGKSFSNTIRVNCLMNISGQPRAPKVDFDLDFPNINADEKQMVLSIINGEEELNQQVVYLLAVGRFYPQQTNNAAENEEGPSKTSLAMQSLLSGTLSGQINSVLNSVINNNNWNFGANISTGDEGWNNAEYEGLISGRLLNNRLLINGQFGYRDNTTTTTPSFIGDFDIRYLLLPNGNLALKVYNQTNDRYFTRSSLNTQGIGIIMKKDFSGLSDLFGIKKKNR